MTLTPEKTERIVSMFLKNLGRDRISEWGVHYGWTRDDVNMVVTARGWALDWEGRLQDRYKRRELVQQARLKNYSEEMREADTDHMIAVGTDHEVCEIRRAAAKAQRAIDDLRRILVLQEEKDAEEVARRKREREQRLSDPQATAHGTWGGRLWHRMNKVPLCGPCEAAQQPNRRSPAPEAQEAS